MSKKKSKSTAHKLGAALNPDNVGEVLFEKIPKKVFEDLPDAVFGGIGDFFDGFFD